MRITCGCGLDVFGGRVPEFTVGVSQCLRRARERFEQRLQIGEPARVRIRRRAREPGCDVHG
jgi:hypothetical protein